MHVISLYLVLHACAAIFDVMCVKKTEATKRGLIYPLLALFKLDSNLENTYVSKFHKLKRVDLQMEKKPMRMSTYIG
jgi:hypothetical protein